MISTIKSGIRNAIGAVASIPFRHSIPPSKDIAHGKWPEYLSGQFNRPGLRVLEVGSRVVTGANFSSLFDQAEYVGFDFYEGPNVDIAGDAHRLSSYFDEPFDLVFSSAVFEHFALPWVVAEEISKVLKIGGHAFTETHFSFNAHERPWNFFQFSDYGLQVLFNRHIGFETVETGMSTPISGYFGPKAHRSIRFQPVPELYCHSQNLSRKVAEPVTVEWSSVEIDELVGGTLYPPA